MSSEQSPLTSATPYTGELPQRRVTTANYTIPASFRPTYTPKNAMAWKPVFDKIMQTREPWFVSEKLSGMKMSTLYLQANDAIKWLMEFAPTEEERTAYTMLRSQISVSRQSDMGGILILFKRSLATAIANSAQPTDTIADWRTAIQKWLETAQSEDVWDSRKDFAIGIGVTDADKQWLIALLAGLDGVEADIQDTYIKIMR